MGSFSVQVALRCAVETGPFQTCLHATLAHSGLPESDVYKLGPQTSTCGQQPLNWGSTWKLGGGERTALRPGQRHRGHGGLCVRECGQRGPQASPPKFRDSGVVSAGCPSLPLSLSFIPFVSALPRPSRMRSVPAPHPMLHPCPSAETPPREALDDLSPWPCSTTHSTLGSLTPGKGGQGTAQEDPWWGGQAPWVGENRRPFRLPQGRSTSQQPHQRVRLSLTAPSPTRNKLIRSHFRVAVSCRVRDHGLGHCSADVP